MISNFVDFNINVPLLIYKKYYLITLKEGIIDYCKLVLLHKDTYLIRYIPRKSKSINIGYINEQIAYMEEYLLTRYSYTEYLEILENSARKLDSLDL